MRETVECWIEQIIIFTGSEIKQMSVHIEADNGYLVVLSRLVGADRRQRRRTILRYPAFFHVQAARISLSDHGIEGTREVARRRRLGFETLTGNRRRNSLYFQLLLLKPVRSNETVLEDN